MTMDEKNKYIEDYIRKVSSKVNSQYKLMKIKFLVR